MGLGTKIKEVLHGDKPARQYNNTTYTTKTPGSFPADDVPRSWGGDDDYDDAFSTLTDTATEKGTYNNTKNTNTTAKPEYTYGPKMATNGGGLDKEVPPVPIIDHNTAATPLTSENVRRSNTTTANGAKSKRLSKEAKSPYWGDTERHIRLEEPALTKNGIYDNDVSDENGNYNGINDNHNRLDELDPVENGVSAGNYDSCRNYSRKAHDVGAGDGLMTSTMAYRPYNGKDTTATSGYDDDNVREYNAPTSGASRGKTAIVGAAAGTAAAGYGASKMASNRHHDDDDVPPYGIYETNRTSPTPAIRRTQNEGYNNGGRGIHTSSPTTATNPGMLDPYSKPQPVAPDSRYNDGSQRGSSGTGSDYGNSPARAFVNGMGDDHYGPGHAGAKVLHRCQQCGADNDISRYFRKDAIYRMS